MEKAEEIELNCELINGLKKLSREITEGKENLIWAMYEKRAYHW